MVWLRTSRIVLTLATAILSASVCIHTPAQQPLAVSTDRERALQLCEQSNFDSAVEGLREAVRKNENDAEAWHCLGLAALARNNKGEARKDFKTAVKAELESFGRLRVANPAQTPVDHSENIGRFETAVLSAEKYIEITPNASADERNEMEELRWYRDLYKGLHPEEGIVSSRDVTTRIRVLSKPPPDFRGTRFAGTAALRGVFSADGTVKHILVIRKVDPDFDRACIAAAKRVEFTPAIKDGRPVSIILELEYARHVY